MFKQSFVTLCNVLNQLIGRGKTSFIENPAPIVETSASKPVSSGYSIEPQKNLEYISSKLFLQRLRRVTFIINGSGSGSNSLHSSKIKRKY
ncbi:MAG: hypothetical protein HY606_10200 [Planctomycetes bacterium]|nr:hypothetical protein [Planctomycetota bacterium]